eukprot:TRINITY_DN7969_c0_g1_i1.p1 TRINITY_DN7969_c0_g1~~TRINITY_DN7969_c0_g1_i1.p1  ORF type:complete len:100 (+),score=9.54 TRINITY_DN7969_c0_g1_i1:40-339(+)
MLRNTLHLLKQKKYKTVFRFNKNPDSWPTQLRLRKEMQDRTTAYFGQMQRRSELIMGTNKKVDGSVETRGKENVFERPRLRKSIPKSFRGKRLPIGFGG